MSSRALNCLPKPKTVLFKHHHLVAIRLSSRAQEAMQHAVKQLFMYLTQLQHGVASTLHNAQPCMSSRVFSGIFQRKLQKVALHSSAAHMRAN